MQRIIAAQSLPRVASCVAALRSSCGTVQPRRGAAANTKESMGRFDSLVHAAAGEVSWPRWAVAQMESGAHGRDDRERPAYRYRST